MRDVIVLIPGIAGSALAIAEPSNEVWGLSGKAIVKSILSLGRNIERLSLPDGLGDETPNDDVIATRLMPDMHLIPGLWSIDGYGQLTEYLRERFALMQPSAEQPGNLILFPYDWRLSNVASAKRLKSVVEPELDRWQNHTQNPEAKLILICHSMGGLVARWFLEMLEGRKITRHLVTIGTPYKGSMKALEYLVNGFSLKMGPIGRDFTKLLRSFPSVYQLLPTYDCIDRSNGQYCKLTEIDIPEIEAGHIRAAASFHEKVAESIKCGGGGYTITAIKGHIQPTAQSAVLLSGRVEVRNEYNGEDKGGDGTVPRPSAHPPEWQTDTDAVFFAQKHASLQNTRGALLQLHGRLTGQLGTFMGGEALAVRLPELVGAGEPIPIVAKAEGGDETLALRVVAQREDGTEAASSVMRNDGRGLYTAILSNLAPGCHRIEVKSAVPGRAVDPVTSIALVWDASAPS